MSDLVQYFHEAAEKDDVDWVKSLHKEFPTLPDDVFTAFKIACEHGSGASAKAMIELRPVLADIKDEHGSTAMHTLSEKGYDEMVQLVGELSPQCFHVEDNGPMTPLHRAATNGSSDVIIELGTICQSSPENLTSDGETAAAGQQTPTDISITNDWNLARWPKETRNELLMIVGFFVAAFFTVTCNLPAALFVEEDSLAGKTFHAKIVISGGLPRVVYLMIFNSAGFMTTMAAVVLLVWPLHFKTILLFLLNCACIVYINLVNGIMPKFFVTIWKFSIPSIALTWSLVLAIVVSGLIMWKCTRPFWRFIYWLRTKRTICCTNTLEDFNV